MSDTFKEILNGAALSIIFLCVLYIAGKVIMTAWINTLENHFKNKSKEKQNEQKEKK